MSGPSAGSLFIVDDDVSSIQVLSSLAMRAGYEVAFARDGMEALPLIEAAAPEVVLLDVEMPGMDGFETCRRLKANPRTAGIPIIFLSGLTKTSEKVQAFEVGGADYVDKPFQPEEVLARVSHQVQLTRLQAEMRAANQRLLELDHLKRTFAAMLVHDLRSPLAVVYSTLGILKGRPFPGDPELDQLVAFSADALDRALAMIAEVLDIYRSEQTGARRPLRLGDVADLIDRCARGAALEARRREIDLEVNVGRPLPAAHDPDRLERALSNLLGNALKFTPAGGRVTLSAGLAGGPAAPHLRIEVRDTGAGIPEAALPHLFELYTQADSAQRAAGVGLGLAIVKRIIDAHDGTITVRSQLGVGTVFTITIPSPPLESTVG